jgi:hypothetical protein
MTDYTCGCFTKIKTPNPVSSEYIQDISASFAVNTKHSTLKVHFSWLIELKKELPKDAYIEAEFPAGDEPFKVPLMGIKDSDRYYAISPPLGEIECQIYPIRINIYEDNRRIKVISQHKSNVLSRISTSNCSKDDFMRVMNKFKNV